ncbi:MAG TPA: thioredoxin-disulfide reductase [Candidatus Methylomirabilis sp.]|nr:thioredoxin-disulfide reductase [Candidatus Methylomirabilis sp.]
MIHMRNVIIIGSGPAGWTAALYAARANLAPLLFEGPEPGGQLTTTTEVENFPGFPKGILGPELMELFAAQAKRFGTEVIRENVELLKVNADGTFTVTAAGKEEQAKTVILSMGATARRLGLESEKALYGKGVSACATCDGFFFKGKNVIIVGGGDSAMEEANFLTRFAASVAIVHRRDAFRASKIMQERTMKNSKIKVIWNSEVAEILGVDVGKVTGVKLRSTVDGVVTDIPIDGVFAAIGHEPNSGLVKGLLDLDEKGYVKVMPGTSKTKIEGLFACGDLQDPHYRQAVTAAGTGCMAALDAEKFLAAL